MRARPARDVVVEAVEAHCGIAGKTKVRFANGPAPGSVADLGEEVWRGDKPPAARGVVVLGTPLGHLDFSSTWSEGRVREEQLLLDQLPSPRANHALRTVPPNHVAAYAVAHDEALWDTLVRCLGGAPADLERDARTLAFLPAALGGLGLQATTVGYWAGWADALPVIQARCPEAAQICVAALEQPSVSTAPCLRSAADARATLQAEGWADCPSWSALAAGARPNTPDENEAGLGDWPHGWQRLVSHTRSNLHYRDCVLAMQIALQRWLRLPLPSPAPRPESLRGRRSARLWPPHRPVRRPRSCMPAHGPPGTPARLLAQKTAPGRRWGHMLGWCPLRCHHGVAPDARSHFGWGLTAPCRALQAFRVPRAVWARAPTPASPRQ